MTPFFTDLQIEREIENLQQLLALAVASGIAIEAIIESLESEIQQRESRRLQLLEVNGCSWTFD